MWLGRGLREGLELLCRAYDADAGQAGVLTLLARFCIMRSDWARARELSAAAQQAADSDSTRALALTLQARAHHAEGNYTEAYRAYQTVPSSAHLPEAALTQGWRSWLLRRHAAHFFG